MGDSVPPAVLKPVSGWIAWPIRIIGPLVLILVLLQPVSAGLFLTGDVTMLTIHELGADTLWTVGAVHLVFCVLAWRPGHRSTLGIWLTVVFLLVGWVQFETGFARLHQAHFPIGVLLALLAAGIAVAGWVAVRRPWSGGAA